MNFRIKLINYFIKYGAKRTKCMRPKRDVETIHIFYRICDHGYPKQKPDYITKENCLKNAVVVFPINKVHWHVIADNVCEETYQMILKYIPENRIERVSVGHGAGTFRLAYDKAIKLKDNELIYFLEDDYLHLPESLDCLIEAARSSEEDYITLYDHPDKYSYFNGGTSFIGAKKSIYFTGHRHWRTTSSTTMTFAAFVDVLKRDKPIFWRWTETKHPYDFQIFVELGLLRHARVISPIPSLSTHGETAFLAPGINWADV